MPEQTAHNLERLHLRASLPKYFRIAALFVLAATVITVGVGFYRARSNSVFRLKGEHAQLSKEVVAEVAGYERLESEGGVPKYFIKADRAVTFSDNHQELENVFLQVYDEAGNTADKLTSSKAIYIPEEDKNFTAYLAGDVNIETRDALKVRTEHITYTKNNDSAEADQEVEFERANIRGTAFGAVVNIRDKKLELQRDVVIESFAGDQPESRLSAGRAVLDQLNERIDLDQGLNANITGNANGRVTDVKAARGSVFFIRPQEGEPQLTKVELFENVYIDSADQSGNPAKINSAYALYEKNADRFELRDSVHIRTAENGKPADIRAGQAVYEQTNGRIVLNGQAEVVQGSELVKGDHMTVMLNNSKNVRSAAVKGNAYLRQNTVERTTEVLAPEINSAFDDSQNITSANTAGATTAVLVPARPEEYSRVTLAAPTSIRVAFKGAGLLDGMNTQGRTTIQLESPQNGSDSSNKRLTADAVRTFFNDTGRDMQKAEAVGNAELFVEPHQASEANYRTTVHAPRFDCEFFPSGNNVKSCTGSTKTKTVRVPTVASGGRGTQTLTSDRLVAAFSASSRDLERLDAAGNAKFAENDRNAIAEQISFTQADQVVRLRGGEPTVWDSRSRAKARDIDWDTRSNRSVLNGGVSTTYYSQKGTGGAAPFADSDQPVYLTANSAEFDHNAEIGIYAGNARGWQDKNYVRAERFIIKQPEGQFFAEGSVQSLLYDARRQEAGRETNVPVYASSRKMTYTRDDRLLRYEGDVDIRQGTDRIRAGLANVYLDNRNEVSRTIAENNVIITQPNRRASGEFAQYTASNESVILRGNPARVEDSESGSSQGGEVTVFLRENRVVGEGKTKQNSNGRIRSVYKVKND